jgi:nitrogen fixation protein NifB
MIDGSRAFKEFDTAPAHPCRSGDPRPSRIVISVKDDINSSTPKKKKLPLPFHPCMHEQAHHQIARLHLPVAVKCNTRCGYCEREISPQSASVVAPGLSAAVLSPGQALAKTREFLDRWGMSSVVGVAGPGEPLANEETLETLRLIRREYHAITLCVCTNGLNLPERCGELQDLGVQHLTVTINGFDPSLVAKIQPTVSKGGRFYEGKRAAQALIDNQTEGLRKAVEAGMAVKVNCVVVPEINGAHVGSVAQTVKDLGALVFNPIPLIPRGLFRHMNKPGDCYMARLRSLCSGIIPVFHHCKQCRADAEGIPGKERAR